MTDSTRERAASVVWAALVVIMAGAAWLFLGTAAAFAAGEPVAATLLLDAAIVAAVGAWRWLDRRRGTGPSWFPRSIGANPWRVIRDALPSLLAAFAAGQALAVDLYNVLGSSGFDAGQDAKVQAGVPLTLLLTLVVAPLAEEAFVRGCVYPLLRRRLPMAVSVVLSACFFALLHGNAVQAAVTVPLGLVLALVYEKTRSLWPCVLLHLGFNLVALVTPVAVIGILTNPMTIVCLIGVFALLLYRCAHHIEPL